MFFFNDVKNKRTTTEDLGILTAKDRTVTEGESAWTAHGFAPRASAIFLSRSLSLSLCLSSLPVRRMKGCLESCFLSYLFSRHAYSVHQ